MKRGSRSEFILLHVHLCFNMYFKHEVHRCVAETGKRDVPETVVHPDPQPRQRGHDPQNPEYHRCGTYCIKSQNHLIYKTSCCFVIVWVMICFDSLPGVGM